LVAPRVGHAVDPAPVDVLKLNDIQAQGTHNSYHRDPDGQHGVGVPDWDYSHSRLERQFEDGVRQVELDIHYNAAKDLFEVYHVWFGDDRSTCDLLTTCLEEIRTWSDAHPSHAPIAILIEPKDGDLEDGDPFTQPIGDAEFDKLDAVLLGAFGDRVLTPDKVQGSATTLRDAVVTNGWPALDAVRQNVLFVMDGDAHSARYSRGWTSLAGRALFVQAEPDVPVAAFVSRGGGANKYQRMHDAVVAGFMVRDLVGAPEAVAAATAAGAQFLSSDTPTLNDEFPVACNPVTTVGRTCDRPLIEHHTPGDYTPPADPSDAPQQVAADKADRLGVNTVESAYAKVTRDPNVAFARRANTSTGRAAFEVGALTITPGSETWHNAARDVLPFDYEQGVASNDAGALVFNGRGALYRTTLGCVAPEDASVPCYDVKAHNPTPISAAEGQQGYNHIGDTSIGRAGPARGFLFTPLEKSPGSGFDKTFKVFDTENLKTAGKLEIKGPFSHHSWVMVDPSGNWMINADATIRTLEVYAITRNPNPPTPEQRIVLTRRLDLDVQLDAGIPADVGPTGCAFRDAVTVYCADWVKDALKRDIRTDVYRLALAAPIGTPSNTGTATTAFSYTVAHKTPSITYGLEGEGLAFYRRVAGGPLELHILVRGERLDSVNLLHFALDPPPAPVVGFSIV
jgi:hypothetical protein